MYLDSKETEIILEHYMSYHFDVNDEGDCKLFMWNLEQHLAQKSLEIELDTAENKVFYHLLSNNNAVNGYPSEFVTVFQETIKSSELH